MIVDFTIRGTREEIQNFRSLPWGRQREILASVLLPGPSSEMTISLDFRLPGEGDAAAGGHGPGKCQKIDHHGGGYLHGPKDDRPYDVDGVTYCGRCHTAMD